MSQRLKVLFFGNHTLGVRTLDVVRAQADLVGVVAHPEDPEDGVRYESIFAAAGRLGVPAVRMHGKHAGLESFVRRCAPDLIWITDFRYLLPAAILALAPRGGVNLHPSLLPQYRGRAPVNWGILRGETRFGLTAHFVDEGMDTGDIIAQRAYELGAHEDVGDALNKLYPLYAEVTAEVLGHFQRGAVPRRVQDHTRATAFGRRTPEDGRVDWTRPALEVRNLIRAVAAPYPGAFSAWGEGRLFFWKAGGIQPFASRRPRTPGEVLAIGDDGRTLTVACGDGALVITRFSSVGADETMLSPGAVLGDAHQWEEAS